MLLRISARLSCLSRPAAQLVLVRENCTEQRVVINRCVNLTLVRLSGERPLIFAKLLAQQLGNPSGIVGDLVALLWNKRNAALNDVVFDSLALSADDRVLEVRFGGGYLLSRMSSVVTDGFLAVCTGARPNRRLEPTWLGGAVGGLVEPAVWFPRRGGEPRSPGGWGGWR